jgi:hypothetical protein
VKGIGNGLEGDAGDRLLRQRRLCDEQQQSDQGMFHDFLPRRPVLFLKW